MNLEISRVMVASTVHVRHDEANPDDVTALYGRNIWTCEYGLMIHVAISEEEEAWPNLEDYGDEPSEGLTALVALCLANDVQWLRLDRDGPEIENIPTYEW